MDRYQIDALAYVINGRPEVSDDFWGDVPSIIRLRDDLPESTLTGLEGFSHLQVVFKFHLTSPQDVHLGARSPRNDPRWEPSGTFAHRNHRRPAQIGISHPRLLKVEGRDLHLVDLDAVDGTPVLDIAPWFAEFGPRGEIRQPSWPTEMLANYWARSS